VDERLGVRGIMMKKGRREKCFNFSKEADMYVTCGQREMDDEMRASLGLWGRFLF
jgi:hypothetical protein